MIVPPVPGKEGVRCALILNHENSVPGGFFCRKHVDGLIDQQGEETEESRGGRKERQVEAGERINKFAVPTSGNFSACLIRPVSPALKRN